jgi:hypothetical protein
MIEQTMRNLGESARYYGNKLCFQIQDVKV